MAAAGRPTSSVSRPGDAQLIRERGPARPGSSVAAKLRQPARGLERPFRRRIPYSLKRNPGDHGVEAAVFESEPGSHSPGAIRPLVLELCEVSGSGEGILCARRGPSGAPAPRRRRRGRRGRRGRARRRRRDGCLHPVRKPLPPAPTPSPAHNPPARGHKGASDGKATSWPTSPAPSPSTPPSAGPVGDLELRTSTVPAKPRWLLAIPDAISQPRRPSTSTFGANPVLYRVRAMCSPLSIAELLGASEIALFCGLGLLARQLLEQSGRGETTP